MEASHNGHAASSTGAAPNGATPRSAGPTVVMGGGPGGLCSAYVLSKAGVPTTVLERAPFVGGLARTIRHQTEHGEFRFDIGGHRWFTKNDELNELFREVVADELLWVNRVSRIYFDGKYVDYPLKISNALKAIGPVVAARAMADFGRTRLAQRLQERPVRSMEDAYIDQFGETLYRLFFQRYSEKVWGLPCEQMSGDWVSQRSKGMSLLTAVKDAVVPSRGKVVSLIRAVDLAAFPSEWPTPCRRWAARFGSTPAWSGYTAKGTVSLASLWRRRTDMSASRPNITSRPSR